MLQIAEELLALATEHGLGFHRTSALAQRGWCLAALGRADEGIPLIIAGMAGWNEIGLIILSPWLLALLGDACRMDGQYQAALAHIAEARRLTEETQERWAEADTLRLTGDALVAMGDRGRAEARYRAAIEIAQRQSAKPWELRSALNAPPRDLLAPVYGWVHRRLWHAGSARGEGAVG